MIRRLLNLLALFSLLLFVAVAALWSRSYWARYAVTFPWRGEQWQFVSVGGHLRVDNYPQRRPDIERLQLLSDEHERLTAGLQGASAPTLLD